MARLSRVQRFMRWSRRHPRASGAAAVVLVLLVLAGVVGDNSASDPNDAAGSSAPMSSTAASSAKNTAATGSASPDVSDTPDDSSESPSAAPTNRTPTTDGDGGPYRFGQLARYSSRGGASTSYEDIPLEIRVVGPTVFKPSKDAVVLDDFGNEVKPLAASVYFTVTIKNFSKDHAYRADFVLPKVETPSARTLADGDIEGIDGSPSIRPGGSLVFKDGYSVARTKGIEYAIAFDGVAGSTLRFAG